MARILFADDDTALRDLASRALRNDGHVVVVARDGIDAEGQLATGAFDVLVSDVEMPGLGGFELVERHAARQPALRFLLISGFLEKLATSETLPAARLATLPKPFTLEQLRVAIRKLLA